MLACSSQRHCPGGCQLRAAPPRSRCPHLLAPIFVEDLRFPQGQQAEGVMHSWGEKRPAAAHDAHERRAEALRAVLFEDEDVGQIRQPVCRAPCGRALAMCVGGARHSPPHVAACPPPATLLLTRRHRPPRVQSPRARRRRATCRRRRSTASFMGGGTSVWPREWHAWRVTGAR
jgi:hypothetical protein